MFLKSVFTRCALGATTSFTPATHIIPRHEYILIYFVGNLFGKIGKVDKEKERGKSASILERLSMLQRELKTQGNLVKSPAHSLGYGHGNIVDGQAPLPEQILSHVRKGSGRVNGIPSHAVTLQVGSGITTLKWRKKRFNTNWY